MDKCEFVVTLDSPMQWKEVDDVFIVTGVALAPGIYQGIDGAKIEYSPDVVKASAPSLLGIDYATAHSPDGKFGGTVVGQATEADTLLYKAVVSKPEAIANVKKGFGTSIEADVKTEWDENKKVWRAVSVKHKMLCQTDKPACPTARVLNVKQVKLEKDKMGNEDEVNALKTEKKVLETKVATLEADISAELAGARGDYMKKCMAGGKSFKECSTAWDSEQEAKMTSATKERDAVKAELETLKNSVMQSELTRLSDGIKTLDKKFDAEVFLKDITDFATKRIVLTKHLEVLQGIKAGTVRLSVDAPGSQGDVTARLNKTSNDFFGSDLDKAAKNIVGIQEEKK